MNRLLLFVVALALSGCCGSSSQPPTRKSSSPVVVKDEPPVPVATPSVGRSCDPSTGEADDLCPVIVPPTVTPAQVVDVMKWLRRTRSTRHNWMVYDSDERVVEAVAAHQGGTTMPKDLDAWERRHRIARLTRWRTDPKAPATVRVQWLWQDERAREIPETVIDPEPTTAPVLPARMQPPPKE